MIGHLAKRMLTEPDLRVLWKFAYSFGWKGMRSVARFERRRMQGRYFPAFLFLSITDQCNLSCQGCWVSGGSTPRELDGAMLDRLVREANGKGCYVFGILGGEPLLHKGLMDFLGRHLDSYFILFTNGTAMDAGKAAELRRLGNVTPLFSVEGLESVSDERRGGQDVLKRTYQGLDCCVKERLIVGVATSVCKTNYADLVSEAFVEEVARRGAMYLWYYIYRPVGPHPCPELALSKEQIRGLRQFLVNIRMTAPLMIVDAYWDHEGRALCPAATGISHHIGPGGDVEPCPPVQFAGENVHGPGSWIETMEGSRYLAGFRELARTTSRGCILLDNPARLDEFLEQQGAHDSSGRGTARAELARMVPCAGHDMTGGEIPEKHWLYRFAKRHWFFGFGAYG